MLLYCIMRFGLNTFLVSSGFTGADLPLIETFEKCGAQLVELAIVEPTSVSVPELKVALAASRLEEPVICGAFGPGRDLRGSSFEIANATHYVSEIIFRHPCSLRVDHKRPAFLKYNFCLFIN